MANISLDDSSLTINLSLDQLDTLLESVSKANALTHVVLAADLDIVDLGALHDFLWALDELIYRAAEVCQHLKAQPATLSQAPINTSATQTAEGNHD